MNRAPGSPRKAQESPLRTSASAAGRKIVSASLAALEASCRLLNCYVESDTA